MTRYRSLAVGGMASGLYMAFAAKLDLAECGMAALAAVLVVAAFGGLQRLGGPQTGWIVPPPWWVAQFAGKLVSDSWLALRALAKWPWARSGGQLRVIPFAPGEETPRDRARRNWVTLGKSFAPNGIVICIDRPNRRLLVHELAPGRRPGQINQEWPA